MIKPCHLILAIWR